jgi:hypothetical protein
METNGTTREESQTMSAIRDMARNIAEITRLLKTRLQMPSGTIGERARQSNEALADFILTLEPGTDNIAQAYSVIKGLDPEDCLDLPSRQMLLDILDTEAKR